MQATSSGNMKMTRDLVYEPYFTLIKDPYLMCLCNEKKTRLIIIHWTYITLQPFQCLRCYKTQCKSMYRLHDSTNGMLKTFLRCVLISKCTLHAHKASAVFFLNYFLIMYKSAYKITIFIIVIIFFTYRYFYIPPSHISTTTKVNPMHITVLWVRTLL